MTAYLGDVKEDVIVHTTINWDLQKEAEFVVKEAVAKYGADKGFTQGALVAMDVDGTVRALVGGVDYQTEPVSTAPSPARRQPGSTFKPFVYLAGMEKGYTPDTVADDAPIDINGWEPAERRRQVWRPDDAARRRWPIRATPSRRCSPTMSAPTRWSKRPCAWAFPRRSQAVPSIALGTQEVSLLELTGGLCALRQWRHRRHRQCHHPHRDRRMARCSTTPCPPARAG